MDMQLLPASLTAIRVFDAVARHLSCSRAADELFLTQSAVSKQLHGLEEYLGVPLFVRLHQGLAMTEAGKVYWEAIRPALVMLTEATAKVRSLQDDNKILNLGIPPTLGQKWLIPRLVDFAEKFPEIIIQFAPRLGHESMSTSMNAEIRFGRGTWPGMSALYLMGRELYPTCSPGLAKRILVNSSEDLLKHNLMEHIQLPQAWDAWFAAENTAGYDARKAHRYEQFSVMIPALIAGLGVGLMPRFLIEEELRKKKLMLLFKHSVTTDFGYYLASPKGRNHSDALEKFSNWLIAEANSAAN
jgi:LysR family glycine cleavage system transcriptional activator